MILFKCSCGTGLKVEDEQAGGRFRCPSCMQEVVAPAESMPDCVLIYQDGGPADGFVIDRSKLEDKITNRELGAWDLIWQDDNWIPLGHVYQFEEEKSPVEDDIPEIALNLSDLPPVEGYAKLPKKRPRASVQGKSSGGGSAGLIRHFREMSLGARLLFLVKFIVVLGILCYGFRRTMKMVNYALKRSAAVAVLAPVGCSGEIRIDGGDWEACGKNAMAVRGELYPPWSTRVSVEFRESGSAGVVKKLKCRVYPGRISLLNPESCHELGIYRRADFASMRLQSDDLTALGRAISAGTAPESAEKVADQLLELGRSVFVGKSRENAYTTAEYDFSRLRLILPGGEMEDDRGASDRNFLCFPLQQSLSFQNCGLDFNPDTGLRNGYAVLPDRQFRLKNGRNVKAPSEVRLFFRGTGQKLELQTSSIRGSLRHQKCDIPGYWEYRASLEKGRWQWQWIFTGNDRKMKVKMIQNMDGREQVVR